VTHVITTTITTTYTQWPDLSDPTLLTSLTLPSMTLTLHLMTLTLHLMTLTRPWLPACRGGVISTCPGRPSLCSAWH